MFWAKVISSSGQDERYCGELDLTSRLTEVPSDLEKSDPFSWRIFQSGARNLDGESYQSEEIYVKPEYRSEGIDTLLKQAQTEFARNLGCDEIRFEPSGVEHTVRLALR